LSHDRRKGDVYASRGIADYWIVNLAERQLEVYRSPAPHAESPSGYRYADRTILTPQQTIVPLNLPLPQVQAGRLLSAASKSP
jgi:Uma2 family endonuclease